jgi:hypothetical protein
MNDSPASTPLPWQQTQSPAEESPPLTNGGGQSLGSGNYQITFLPGGTDSIQPSPPDLLPNSESSRPVGVAPPTSSQNERSLASRNPASESTQEQTPAMTETLPSGSIVHRPTSEQFRPYRLGQGVTASTPSVNAVRYVCW